MVGSSHKQVMRWTGILLGGFVGALLVVACTGELGTSSSPATSGGRVVPSADSIDPCPVDPDAYIGGDPGRAECPAVWRCETLVGGTKVCTNPGPDLPDGGHTWECEDGPGGITVCSGSDAPDGGGGGEWICEQENDLWVCRTTTPDYPPTGEIPPGSPGSPGNDAPGAGGEGSWECYFVPGPDGPARVCQSRDEPPSSETPPAPPPDEPPGSETPPPAPPPPTPPPPPPPPEGPPGCECIPGAERFCDTPTYCSWGKQTCAPDGQWGSCIETTPPGFCIAWAPEYYDLSCCLAAGECCQNFPVDDSSVGDCADISCR